MPVLTIEVQYSCSSSWRLTRVQDMLLELARRPDGKWTSIFAHTPFHFILLNELVARYRAIALLLSRSPFSTTCFSSYLNARLASALAASRHRCVEQHQRQQHHERMTSSVMDCTRTAARLALSCMLLQLLCMGCGSSSSMGSAGLRHLQQAEVALPKFPWHYVELPGFKRWCVV